jgi:hypothetical protein
MTGRPQASVVVTQEIPGQPCSVFWRSPDGIGEIEESEEGCSRLLQILRFAQNDMMGC